MRRVLWFLCLLPVLAWAGERRAFFVPDPVLNPELSMASPSPCTREALLSTLKHYLPPLSTHTDIAGVYAVYRTPAESLRDQAAEIERRDSMIREAQTLIHACERELGIQGDN